MSKLSITPLNPNDKTISLGYCPYMEIMAPRDTYPTLMDGIIAPEKRGTNENVAIPESLPNGGLYNSPQSMGQWANIPVIPTELNMIHYNLRSANPPPGATEQYMGTDRLGNNYAPKIGVYWYNNSNTNGMYRMMVTKASDAKQY
jgi:hypothetical protein